MASHSFAQGKVGWGKTRAAFSMLGLSHTTRLPIKPAAYFVEHGSWIAWNVWMGRTPRLHIGMSCAVRRMRPGAITLAQNI